MHERPRSPQMALLAVMIVILPAFASGSDVAPVDYAREIKPILKSKCYACHGALKQEVGLRLDTGRSIRQGSKTGQVVEPGHSSGSLIERIGSNDQSVRMPPEGEPLKPDQIAVIARWIEQGAQSPDDEQPEVDPRRHWAFQPPVRPEVPRLVDVERLKNPIDAFAAQERATRHLTGGPPAARHFLLRRVFLDLIGVPPTRDELHQFLADESPDAYEKVVDRLLESAQYGERWGRHWMDVWRYSDWFGRRYVPDVWNSAPQIWRWRDWIVDSLNSDKGYGQMVTEMLAADEVVPEDDQAAFATGYLIRNWYALNPNDWMRSNVEHTGKAFLGLTFNCAHCHDHKYDPISQDDYFRFRAFFEPISVRQDRVPGEAEPGPFAEYQYGILRKIVRLGGVRIFDKTPDASTWFYTGGDERNRVAERGSIPPGVPAFLVDDSVKIAQVKLPPRAWHPGLRPSIHATILNELQTTLAMSESQLPSARESAATAIPDLQAKLAAAESEFETARKASIEAGRAAAFVGQQSLVLDATTGRRILHNGLRSVTSIGDGATIRFQMQIIKDAHVNFQLAKDVEKGRTAAYVGFDQGRILSYPPGSTTKTEFGKYNFADGQNRFEIRLVLKSKEDLCLLTVRSLSDQALLVDGVAVARDGWVPGFDVTRAITFDVRTGGVAAFDEFELIAPNTDESGASAPVRLVGFDFESPLYRDLCDVVGVDGWFESPLSVAGATSLVSSTVFDESLWPFAQKVHDARRAIDSYELKVKSLEAKRRATLAEIESAKARIAADQAKYEGTTNSTETQSLLRVASQQHRTTSVLTAQADLIAADHLLAVAELKPTTDANRAKELDSATKQLSAAAIATDHARAEQGDPGKLESYPALSPTYPDTSTGRRKALAEWIASRSNPLTARVAVNHIWLRHFHSPLVATVSDFGVNGKSPTHPQLLDWLAVELMESGWSVKRLHRLIVTSDAYAMSSDPGLPDNPSRAADPQNEFLWRMNAGRMEAEAVRDSVLSVAEQLDSQMRGQELENSQALTTRRRTIYYCCQPEIDGKSAFGMLFDAPESTECYRRTQSIIPQQALALTNSDLIHELSAALAGSLWRSLAPDRQTPSQFVIAACEQILSRAPTDEELRVCLGFLGKMDSDEANATKLREGLVRVLFNHNDFIAIR